MNIDNIIPFTIRKIPAPQYLTFDCHRGHADLSTSEGSCVPHGFYNTHTYDLAIRLSPDITGIAGYVTAGNQISDDMPVRIQIKDVGDDTWETIREFPINKNQVKQFECYPPYPTPVGLFRIRFLESGGIIHSKGKIQVGDTPADQHTQAECEAAGGYWYNNSCHLIPPLCYILDNQSDCTAYGCYWANGECHPYPTSCEGWLTQQDCVDNDCSWWDENHPYLPNTCHDPRMIAKRLAMSPDIPADIHSTTPPGSLYAEFPIGELERIKIFRGFGEARIGGTNYLTTLCFWLDNKPDLWQNRVKVFSGQNRTFDENYALSSEYNRFGHILRVGVKGTEIPLDHLNMVLLYRLGTEITLLSNIQYPTPVSTGTDVPVSFKLTNSLSGGIAKWIWFDMYVNDELKHTHTFGLPGGVSQVYTRYTGELTMPSTFTIAYGHENSIYPAHGPRVTDGTTPKHAIEVR